VMLRFTNWMLVAAPQLVSYDESQGVPLTCP
jgi:hypothetical protein